MRGRERDAPRFGATLDAHETDAFDARRPVRVAARARAPKRHLSARRGRRDHAPVRGIAQRDVNDRGRIVRGARGGLTRPGRRRRF